MGHRTALSITWGDTDAGGLIYYPQFFHYTVVALNDYFEPAVDGPHPMTALRDGGYVLPAVASTASFHWPLRAGDRVEVETTVVEFGESSLTATFSFERPADEETAADIEVSFVLVDSAFESQPLPPAFRDCVDRRGDGSAL